jgi:hypothetical protein
MRQFVLTAMSSQRLTSERSFSQLCAMTLRSRLCFSRLELLPNVCAVLLGSPCGLQRSISASV